MTFTEIRKFAVAVLTAVAAIIPQVLGTLAGVIPENVASALTIVAVTAGAILVWLVPNGPADPVAKAQKTLTELGPLFEYVRAAVRAEVSTRQSEMTIVNNAARHDTRLLSSMRQGPRVSEPAPPAAPDPFVVPPAGR
ncbi:hypothetical protein [Rhodococcus sp. AH-ZY2]|uniref:hypothetical protein n=1 Tax=Rhodococcus sp. AH-ZY2 TaxID=3047468 RepID=UPI0027E0B16F|nr:hypothetical protein [Rhodococcus sp. AH-ZY2]WML63670.1 hypothetical protein QNA09_02290 [Rhodococcus sp. AH-ZY2]